MHELASLCCCVPLSLRTYPHACPHKPHPKCQEPQLVADQRGCATCSPHPCPKYVTNLPASRQPLAHRLMLATSSPTSSTTPTMWQFAHRLMT
jgi:hypothetical protein